MFSCQQLTVLKQTVKTFTVNREQLYEVKMSIFTLICSLALIHFYESVASSFSTAMNFLQVSHLITQSTTTAFTALLLYLNLPFRFVFIIKNIKLTKKTIMLSNIDIFSLSIFFFLLQVVLLLTVSWFFVKQVQIDALSLRLKFAIVKMC